MSSRSVIAVFFAIALSSLFAAPASAQSADLGITKSGPATASPGDDVAYTITVTNFGADPADGVTITDNVPAGMTFVSDQQTGGPAFTCSDPSPNEAGTILCSMQAPLAANQSATFIYTFHIPSDAAPGTTFTNIATVSLTSQTVFDPNDENNSATAATTIPVMLADLAASKSGPASAIPDSDVTYTIGISNNGPDAAANATLTDTLPGAMTFVSLTQTSGPAFSCTTPAVGAGGTIICTAGSLPLQGAATFTLVGHVPPGTGSGTTFTNSAGVSSKTEDPGEENNLASTTLTVSSADVSIAKSAPATVVAGGAPMQYVITVTNGGTDFAQDVAFFDALPAGTTFVQVAQNSGPTASCGGPAVGTNGTVSCSMGLMAPNTSAQFTITVNVGASVPSGTVLSNTATVSSSTTGDPNPNNNSSNAQTTVTTQFDIVPTKNGPATIIAGNDITYTISVTNNGPSDAQNVSFTDATPASTTFVSLVQAAGWSCTKPAAGGTGTITCSTATLAVGATANFTLTLHVASSAGNGTTISNSVNLQPPDANASNNFVTSNAVVSHSNDLAITKNGPATVSAGGNISYTIAASNNGPSDASQVSITDSTPANTTFSSIVVPAGWSCTTPAVGSGGAITCTISNWTAGASANFTLNLAVSPSAPNASTIANTAQITSTYPDPAAGNNQSTSTATVTTGADLSITKTGPATATAGSVITYSIVVMNNGPADAQNVTVTDSTVNGVTTFANYSAPAGWSCTTPPAQSTGTITCTTATLAAGASATLSLSFNVNSGAPSGSSVANTASVSSTTSDPNNANNNSTATATAGASADLAATKSGPATAAAGTAMSYTIGITNNGPSNAANATLTDVLPSGTKFVSLTQTGGSPFTCSTPAAGASGTVSCSISSLAAAGSATFTLVVTNPGSGSTYVNTNVVSSPTADPNSGNNSASASTVLTAGSADLAVTKSAVSANVITGQNATFTITITNAGPANADNVVATDAVPAGTFVSATPSQGTCNPTVQCTMGTIAPGASATITLVIKASNTVAPASNTVTVTTSSVDPDPTNNTATATYNVVSAIPAMSPFALLLTAFVLAFGGVIAMKSRG